MGRNAALGPDQQLCVDLLHNWEFVLVLLLELCGIDLNRELLGILIV